MADAAKLRELADKVEKLSGPDRETDCLIHNALWGTRMWADTHGFECHDTNGHGGMWRANPPRYTASLDAAMTLVPEGWWLEALSDQISAGPDSMTILGCMAELGCYGRLGKQRVAETRPLAVASAALRARAALAEREGAEP